VQAAQDAYIQAIADILKVHPSAISIIAQDTSGGGRRLVAVMRRLSSEDIVQLTVTISAGSLSESDAMLELVKSAGFIDSLVAQLQSQGIDTTKEDISNMLAEVHVAQGVITSAPTAYPTAQPTRSPTKSPSRTPTRNPTRNPTATPTRMPTIPVVAVPKAKEPIQTYIPKADCIMSEFQPVESCSKSCGGGVQTVEAMVYQQGSGGGEMCVTDAGSTDSHTLVRKCNTQPCEEAKPWCWQCAEMAEGSSSLAPNGVESILPQERFPFSTIGSTLASASNGDMCETQLYSCRKKRLQIFSNMDMPQMLTQNLRPYVTKLAGAVTATDWLEAILGISRSVSPYFTAGSVPHPRLYVTFFTYARRGRAYHTTTEIAADVTAVCDCIATAKGVHDGAVAYTSTKDEL